MVQGSDKVNKQFYTTTIGHQSQEEITNDYFNQQQQRSVPVLADHSLITAKNRSPNRDSKNSADFQKAQKLNPDQQLHIYTQ